MQATLALTVCVTTYVHGNMQMILLVKLSQINGALDKHDMEWEWNADRGYSLKWITLCIC